MTSTAGTSQLLERLRVDLDPPHRQPSGLRLLLATVVSVVGSLVADALLVVLGTRISSAPRWLFVRLAILVTLVLLLPDVYILVQGQSGEAIAILVLMHLAIAAITYNSLVRIAPTRPLLRHRRGRAS